MQTNDIATVKADEALALAHVRHVKAFYIHAAQYVVAISIFAIGNYMLTPRHFWSLWVAIGWGGGLLFHGLRVFDKIPFLNAEWEKRQVEKHLGRRL